MMNSARIARGLWTTFTFFVLFPSVGFSSSVLPFQNGYRMQTSKCNARFSKGAFEYYNPNSSIPEFAYQLHSLRFGEVTLDFRGAPRMLAKSDVFQYDYGTAISEVYTPRQDGIEQSWLIKQRPTTHGPIVIEGRILSQHIQRNTPTGIDFIDHRGRIALSYGAVTVIDAVGREYRCMPQIARGVLKISVPESYIQTAVFPITIDPVVGPRVPISPMYEPADGIQENAEVAASPYGFLVVWQDNRGTNGTDIFGCRLDENGQVIDESSIAICTAIGDQTDPAVTWDGQQYVVAWSDKREISQHIYAARVRFDGEVLDKQGILTSGTNGIQAYARIASDGGSSLVVWQDSRGTSNDIYGCKLGQDGLVGRTYPISALSDNEEMPDIVWNGSTFTVVWCDYRNMASYNSDIYGCRVSKSGIKMGKEFIVSCNVNLLVGASGAQRAPRITSFGTGCLVVWEDSRNSSDSSDLYCARVNPSGTVLDTSGIAICREAGDQELASVGFDGTKCLTVWRNRSGRLPKAARVSIDGNVLDTDSITLSSAAAGSGGTATVGKNGDFLVVWNSLSVMNSDVIGVMVTDGGSLRSPGATTLSLAHDDQLDISSADVGSQYAVVWSQKVNGSYDILGMLMSYSGEPLLSEPVNLTSKFAGDQTQPSIAWNGSRYLLVWCGNENVASNGWDIRGLILDAALKPVSSNAISISTSQEDQARPSVASNGSNFFVSWEDSLYAVSPNYYTDLFGTAVNADGSVAKSTAALCMATGDQRYPRVASNGTDYLVVWEDHRSGTATYANRVSSAGALLGLNTEIKLPATTTYQTVPDVCFGGGNYLVVWSDWNRISGCRIGPTGSLLDGDGLTICTGSKEKEAPCVCWDGNMYRVVWEDYRSSLFGNADVFYTTVSKDGTVSPESARALISSLDSQYKPKIYFRGAGGALFYADYINYSHFASMSTLADQDVQLVDTVAHAKALSTGTPITLSGKIVTAAYTGYFYIEEPDRTSGIRVLSDLPVSIGQIVEVTGIIEVCDGERQINCNLIRSTAAVDELLRPVAIRGDMLGGGPLNDITPGVIGGVGLNNIGLLVTTWGQVVSTGSGYFVIESKPGVQIKVKSGSLSKPASGSFVAVTGISSCEIISSAVSPALLLREQSDIVLLK